MIGNRLVYVATALVALILGQATPVLNCVPGWLPWNNSCYMITPTKMLWRDAHQLCHSFGARMAVPSSEEENNFMGQVASKLNTNRGLWIDCTDKDEEGTWVCSEDDPAGAGYRNWEGEQPNDYPGNGDGTGADFAEMWADGSGWWSDVGDFHQYSICEMKPTCNTDLECRNATENACN